MIFTSEIDIAFKSLLETITASNGKPITIIVDNQTVPNPEYVRTAVKVIPSFPDKDFEDMEFPSISFRDYDQKAAKDRQRYEEYTTVADDNETFDTQKSNVVYNLYYEINFYSKSKMQMNDMIAQWVAKTPRHFLLEVVNSDGDTELVPVLFNDYEQRDFNSKEKRYYIRTYYYILNGYIEDQSPETHSINEVVIRGITE